MDAAKSDAYIRTLFSIELHRPLRYALGAFTVVMPDKLLYRVSGMHQGISCDITSSHSSLQGHSMLEIA